MIINIDFDGTCVSHEFPEIGKSIGAEKVLKRLVDNGHQLILFTMRSDKKKNIVIDEENNLNNSENFLTAALDWFKQNGIPLYGIQTNPKQHTWTESPKSYAHLTIDDNALGCPLINDIGISKKPFVCWETVEFKLTELGYFKDSNL